MRSATFVLIFLFGCSLNICVEFATATCHHGHDDHGHDDHGHDDHGHSHHEDEHEDHDDHGHDDHDHHDGHDEENHTGDDNHTDEDSHTHGEHEHDHDDHDHNEHDDEQNHSDEQNHTDEDDECDDEHDHAEDAHDDHHEWGLAIGGSMITVAPATFGILLLPFLQMCGGKLPKFVLAFGSGTILGAAVFLLLPEALHLTGEDADEEVDGTWPWGTGILAGWFFGMVLHHLVQIAGAALKKPAPETTNEKIAAKPEEDVMMQPLFRRVNWDVVSAVFFGDLMHNFVDGIALGIAAKQCSSTFFWTLVWTTVAHEGPQEIADQAVLQEQANMKWYEGLTVNVICSLSTLIGAVISHEANIDVLFQGVLLACGGGVYLFVALTELGQKVVHLEERNSKAALIQSLSSVAAYAVGAVAIGLVLLEHDHCEGAGHDHSGHAH